MWIGPNATATDDTFACEQLDHGFRTLHAAALRFGDDPRVTHRAVHYDRLLEDARIDFPRALKAHFETRFHRPEMATRGPFFFNISGHRGIWGKHPTEKDNRGIPINVRVAKMSKGEEHLGQIICDALNQEGA